MAHVPNPPAMITTADVDEIEHMVKNLKRRGCCTIFVTGIVSCTMLGRARSDGAFKFKLHERHNADVFGILI